MSTRLETIDKMTKWIHDKDLPMDTLREVARDVHASPLAAGLCDTSLIAIAVRRVVRDRVEAELRAKSDDELRIVAAQLSNAAGNYVDRLLGPAQSDVLEALARERHPEAAAAVDAWEMQDESLDLAPTLARHSRLGAFDYYATTAQLS